MNLDMPSRSKCIHLKNSGLLSFLEQSGFPTRADSSVYMYALQLGIDLKFEVFTFIKCTTIQVC